MGVRTRNARWQRIGGWSRTRIYGGRNNFPAACARAAKVPRSKGMNEAFALPRPETTTPRRGRVRLRTLIAIRWLSVAGHAAALLVVYYGLGFPLPIVAGFVCIGASVLFNLWVSRVRGRLWLGDRDAALTLAYDQLQLCALLFLTGGLHNPFCMMVLAPVTVAATLLTRASTFALSGLTVAMVTVLALAHEPLPWPDRDFVIEPIYVFAAWL